MKNIRSLFALCGLLWTALSLAAQTETGHELFPIDPSLEAVGLDGRTFYVSPDGDDDNDGLSVGRPMRLIQTAADQLEPGDTLLVRGGTYEAAGASGNNLHFTGQGIADHWIRIAAYPGETPVISIRGWRGVVLEGARYVLFEGFTVRGYNTEIEESAAVEFAKTFRNDDYSDPRFFTTGITITFEKGSDYPHHIILRGNTIHGCSGNGIAVKRADYILIEGNRSFENAYYSPWGTSGISVWSSWNYDDNAETYRTVLRNNVSYRNENRVLFWIKGKITDGNGIIIDALTNVQSDIVGDGYTEPYGGRILLANNLCYENGGRGLNLFESERIDAVHNTLYHNSRHPDLNGEVCLGGVDQVRLFNNIMIESPGQRSIEEWRHANSGPGVYQVGYNFTRSGPGGSKIPLGVGALSGDPKFVGADSANFRLRRGSPAVDAGSPAWSVASDLTGAPRPQGSDPDLGAYEQ